MTLHISAVSMKLKLSEGCFVVLRLKVLKRSCILYLRSVAKKINCLSRVALCGYLT
jgi:hypothetical protein